jgi:peptidyl-prolyl cis-trans isomerase NIMA-interacting 1
MSLQTLCSNDHRVSHVRQWHFRVGAFAALCAMLFGSSCTSAPSSQPGGGPPAERGEPPAEQSASSSALGASGAAAEPGPAAIERVLPYPRGRWRLASLEELHKIMLRFSHILIRYDGVLESGASFCLFDWFSAYPPSKLSREDALALARRIAQEAAAGKVPFADLVAAHSEDITTAGRGGSLGAVTASMLDPWPQILDALAVLKPGQTSEVVETPYGFHILQKRAPLPEQTVSGARIVIAHDDAQALRFFHIRGDVPRRSRADAEALALEIYRRARSNPADFSALVDRHSEHVDAEVEGDLGQWSTHEGLAPAREIEVLSELQVGEVAAPIETFLGFQILMRTADRDRPEFAHEAIELMYTRGAPEGHPESEAIVRERAAELGARLSREPQAFDALRQELCCRETHVWREGRMEKSVQTALSALSIGEIGTTPVRTVSSYALMRRLDPKPLVHTPAASLELPSNVVPDLDAFLGWRLDPWTAEGILRSLGTLVADELRLEGEGRTRLLESHEVRSGIGTGDERVQAVAAIAGRTKQLLDPVQYQTYKALAIRLVEQAVVDPPRSVSSP